MSGSKANKPTKQAYDSGRQAFYKGKLDSPYRKRSILHKEWVRGFDTAYFDNLQQVTK